jgi:membrane protein implicated in regulation of membrane protease activity
MSLDHLFLVCFAFGFVWSAAALFLGSFHLHGHAHGHAGHGHACSHSTWWPWGELFTFHSLAIFLAWFGGCGFLMARHTRFGLLIVTGVSVVAGLIAAVLLASFLRFLHARERPLDPFDYEMVGVLGRVTSPIRGGGFGEIQFVRDGARVSAPARSDDGEPIGRSTEVVVTRFERGVAFVRTWDALTGDARFVTSSSGDGEKASPTAD